MSISCECEEITPLHRYLRVFAPLGHWTSRESFFTDQHRAAEPKTLSGHHQLAENFVAGSNGRRCLSRQLLHINSVLLNLLTLQILRAVC